MAGLSDAEMLGIDLAQLEQERFTTPKHLELMKVHRARREAWESLLANHTERKKENYFTDKQFRIALASLEKGNQ